MFNVVHDTPSFRRRYIKLAAHLTHTNCVSFPWEAEEPEPPKNWVTL